MFIHKDIKEALPNVNYNITMFLKLNAYYMQHIPGSYPRGTDKNRNILDQLKPTGAWIPDPRLENETILYSHWNETLY